MNLSISLFAPILYNLYNIIKRFKKGGYALRATIKDVAKHAGVSVASISRFLNKKGYVSEATQTKIKHAIQELNYQPNEVARALFKRETKTIGVIIPNIRIYFFSELVNYIEYYASKMGYRIMLCNTDYSSDRERDYLEMLRNQQIDGIILGSHSLPVEQYKNLQLPVISVDRFLDDKIPLITSDNRMGGKLAAEKLYNSGCKHVGYFGLLDDKNNLTTERYSSFKKTCIKLGMICIAQQPEYTKDIKGEKHSDLDLVRKFISENEELDGLFTVDPLALAAIRVCQERGLKIPSDFQIIGYDDLSFAKMTFPSITTIKQPISQLAEVAIGNLIDSINCNAVQNRTILPVSLIERETTKNDY